MRGQQTPLPHVQTAMPRLAGLQVVAGKIDRTGVLLVQAACGTGQSRLGMREGRGQSRPDRRTQAAAGIARIGIAGVIHVPQAVAPNVGLDGRARLLQQQAGE